MQKISKISIYLVILAFILVLFGAFHLLLANPQLAFAKLVSPSVTTTAQVQTNGSLHISEQRQVVFNDEYRSIWWSATGFDSESKIENVSVRAARIDENGEVNSNWITFREVPFQTLWRDALAESKGLSDKTPTATGAGSKAGIQTSDDIAVPGYYAFAIDSRDHTIYTFFPSNEDSMVFDIDYTVSDVVMSFDDVAELYWDYAPARDNMQVLNTTASIQLPVPEGQLVLPNENVFAWGHGPAGSVDIREDGTISYSVELIEPGQYGQAHVIFPVGWLTNLTIMQKLEYSGTRLDSAKAEETSWSDTWSYWLANQYMLDIMMLAICLIVVAVSALLYLKYSRRVQVEEKTINEKADYILKELEKSDTAIPHIMDVNPAEAGRIHRWNRQSTSDFVAMLMGLTYSGVITSNACAIEKSYSNEQGIRFHLASNAKSKIATPLGAETLKLLFDICGEGYQSISTEEILAFAKRNPDTFSESIEAWQDALTSDMKRLKGFDKSSFKLQRTLYVVTAIMAIIGLFFAIADNNALLSIAFIASSIIIGIVGNYTPRRTQYGERTERLIEVLINKVCESDHIDANVAKVILPYALAHGRAQELYSKIDDPSPVETIWFRPGVVRFKQSPPMVDRLSDELEQIALRPDEPPQQ